MAGELLEMVSKLADWVPMALTVVGTITAVMTAVVLLTPTKKDDKILKKIETLPIIGDLWKALEKFSVVSRKQK